MLQATGAKRPKIADLLPRHWRAIWLGMHDTLPVLRDLPGGVPTPAQRISSWSPLPTPPESTKRHRDERLSPLLV